eukprot:Colp12_sorted_trinity150504_noHs@27670
MGRKDDIAIPPQQPAPVFLGSIDPFKPLKKAEAVQRKRSFIEQPPDTIAYTVNPHDTLAAIAVKNGATVAEIMNMNKLSSGILYPGQVLYLKPKPQSAPPSPRPAVNSIRPHPSFEELHAMRPKDLMKAETRYITQDKGVVPGILTLSPDHVIFEPEADHPLVADLGILEYQIFHMMSEVAHVSVHHDVGKMRGVIHLKDIEIKKKKKKERQERARLIEERRKVAEAAAAAAALEKANEQPQDDGDHLQVPHDAVHESHTSSDHDTATSHDEHSHDDHSHDEHHDGEQPQEKKRKKTKKHKEHKEKKEKKKDKKEKHKKHDESKHKKNEKKEEHKHNVPKIETMEVNGDVPVPPERLESKVPLFLRLRIIKEMKRHEFWFTVPREKIDEVFAFFIKYMPHPPNPEEESGSDESYEDVDPDFESLGDAGSSHKISGSNPNVADIPVIHEPSPETTHIPQPVAEPVAIAPSWSDSSLFDSCPLNRAHLLAPSQMIDNDEVAELSRYLPRRLSRANWFPIYSTYNDGISLKTFFRKFLPHEGGSVILFKDYDGHVFGGYAPEPWRMSEKCFGNGQSFVFTVRPKLGVYKWTGRNDYFMRGSLDSIFMGCGDRKSIEKNDGSTGNFAFWIDSDFNHGSSGPCMTYDNPVLSGKPDFLVQGIETWGFMADDDEAE